MNPSPVSIEQVVKQFGATRAVNDVTVRIEAGELFFLLGPSGCGKTTLLRCIAGFYWPEAGRIRIGEQDVTRMPPHLRETGMVFQSYALWPHMSVRENVAFGLQMRKVGRDEQARRVDEVLETVRLTTHADHRPNQLSGGQQQRVALARALVIRPRCLLLDEPLSNLDAKLRLDMRTEIRRICKEAGLTAIYVTHDQKEALSIADRLAVMESGVIRQVGKPRDVYERPRDAFVATFIGETNFVKGSVARRENGVLDVDTAIGRFRSTVDADGAIRTGATVNVSIRPEVIRLGRPPAEAVNVFDGIVHDSIYLGEVAQHEVRVNGVNGGEGLNLKAYDLNPRIVARDEPEAAPFWIDPTDVVVLGG